MMKTTTIKGLLTSLFLGVSAALFAQNIAINTTGAQGNASTILDLSNTGSYAFLPPQVALTNVATLAPVPGPGPAGLVVYSTTAPAGGGGTGLYFWDAAKWNYLSTGAASSGWALTGNAATTPGTNYAGTSDVKDFVVKTNAVERMRFMSSGAAGVGTPTPKSAMDVVGNMSLGTYAGVTAAPANGMIISGQVGIGTNAPNSSAVLDVTSTTTGFLPPRMTGAQMLAIATPAIGLLVLNSTTNCMEYWSGVSWQNVVCPCSAPPATPGIISGPATPCQSSAGNVYTIAAVPNATSYNWTVPAGASITANTGTSITVTFGTTSGNITVTASNSCGTSGVSTLAIVLSTPPATPAVPSGSSAPLISTANTYTIATVAGATSYTWTTSNSTLATVTGGQGTTSATITSTATAGTYTICVYATNACGNSATSCLTVTSSSCATILNTTLTFNYTGAAQNWTVPCGVSSITVTLYGAQGALDALCGAYSGTYPATGGTVIGTMAVVAGTTYQIFVGGGGAKGTALNVAAAGGFNGGGAGAPSPSYGGGGGGGASDIRVTPYGLANRVVVAGGGGGMAYNYGCATENGGRGGSATGECGTENNALQCGNPNPPGAGGSQVGGGIGGFYSGYCTASNGVLGIGGAAGTCSNSGGGGGGGYYGGGGAVWGGGGGGSNYVGGLTTTTTNNMGGGPNGSSVAANGQVLIHY